MKKTESQIHTAKADSVIRVYLYESAVFKNSGAFSTKYVTLHCKGVLHTPPKSPMPGLCSTPLQ
ncbi:MAG: hypothetical protein V2I97_01840 [Desulfococcaceae bacterium]|jgi:hypothetical protein|nr:hypothetical protein [Desulfococcaceae bacterium]